MLLLMVFFLMMEINYSGCVIYGGGLFGGIGVSFIRYLEVGVLFVFCYLLFE